MKIQYLCDYCGSTEYDRPSHYNRKKRHFCSQKCYSEYRKHLLPKEEQNAYKGGGLSIEEVEKRKKARSDANHAIRNGRLKRKPCEACGSKHSQAHHHDYNKPLDVKWLCRKCHWQEHKLIYENSELLEAK